MGLFSRRNRAPAPPPPPPPPPPTFMEGQNQVLVVGESYCQDAILQICGPKCEEGFCLAVLATLVRDPANPYDPNAVGVYVQGLRVGYLSRLDAANISPRLAARPAPVTVRGQINGGWDRGDGDEGHFGVVLQMPSVEEI